MELIFFVYLWKELVKQLSSLLKISVSILLIFTTLTASGGDPYRPSAGAGEAATGYVCVMKNGFWSSFHNQALLPGVKTISFGFNYENRFGISELGTRSAGVIIPAGNASLGAVYSDFGYSDFKRNMAGLSCGLKISDKLSAGIQADYFSEKTSGEYKNNQIITCEMGLLYCPTGNTLIGIHLFNPVPNSLRKAMFPSSLRIGAGFWLNKSLFTGAGAEMSTGSKLILKTGFEYEVLKEFRLRGGFSTDNNSFSFGLGYLAKIALIDVAFVTHEKLGVTSSVSFIFKIH